MNFEEPKEESFEEEMSKVRKYDQIREIIPDYSLEDYLRDLYPAHFEEPNV